MATTFSLPELARVAFGAKEATLFGLPLVKVAFTVVCAVSLFFLIGGTLGGALANALHVNVLNVRPSWQSTLSVAHQTYATAPLFGSGPGTFGTQWLKYRDANCDFVADQYKGGVPVIINLRMTEQKHAPKILQFASGLVYGLNGRMQKVGEQVFLLTPFNMEVSADEKRRLAEHGLFGEF